MRQATKQYRNESDLLGCWIDERCVTGKGFEQKASALYSDFRTWCAESGEADISSARFGRQLRDGSFTIPRSWSGIVYECLGLRAGV